MSIIFLSYHFVCQDHQTISTLVFLYCRHQTFYKNHKLLSLFIVLHESNFPRQAQTFSCAFKISALGLLILNWQHIYYSIQAVSALLPLKTVGIRLTMQLWTLVFAGSRSLAHTFTLMFKKCKEGHWLLMPKRPGQDTNTCTQKESHSGGTSVEFYTNVTLLSTLRSQRWQYVTIV